MGNYYETKLKAIRTINALVKTGVYSKNSISFMILREYGFSKKFCEDYIGDSVEQGLFEIKNELVMLKQNGETNE